jgi:hypothetical protein
VFPTTVIPNVGVDRAVEWCLFIGTYAIPTRRERWDSLAELGGTLRTTPEEPAESGAVLRTRRVLSLIRPSVESIAAGGRE